MVPRHSEDRDAQRGQGRIHGVPVPLHFGGVRQGTVLNVAPDDVSGEEDQIGPEPTNLRQQLAQLGVQAFGGAPDVAQHHEAEWPRLRRAFGLPLGGQEW